MPSNAWLCLAMPGYAIAQLLESMLSCSTALLFPSLRVVSLPFHRHSALGYALAQISSQRNRPLPLLRHWPMPEYLP